MSIEKMKSLLKNHDNDYYNGYYISYIFCIQTDTTMEYSNGFKFTEEKITNSYLYTYVYSRKKKKNKTKIFNRRILTKVW